MHQDILKDIYQRLQKSEGCWLWQGRKNAKGYGQIYRKGKDRLVHRVMFESVNGPLLSGQLVCHRCDVPGCANPNHLFAGSYTDNNRDSVNKGRSKAFTKKSCVHGHAYEPNNIIWRRLKTNPTRNCKTCVRARKALERKRRSAGMSEYGGPHLPDGVCRVGHIIGPENQYLRPQGRECLICKRLRDKRRSQAKAKAVAYG